MLNTIPGILIHCSPSSSIRMSSGDSENVFSGALVTTGQPLLTLPMLSNQKNSPVVILEAGEYTQLRSDGCELLSCCYGYPRITVAKKDDISVICASLIPLVEVSKDGMEARINLFPPLLEEDSPNLDIILLALKQQGVLYGIDRHALETVLIKLKEDGQPLLSQLTARGKAPVEGKDAYIRFEVEIGPLPGKILADGSIDFRERLMFVGVKKDQLLACKVPATKGHPGINLAGEQLEATDGKDIAVKISEDIHYCESDGTIRATVSGVLSVVGEDTIRVSSKQQIEGDVDFTTGNIRSNDSVDISGSVLPNFLVSVKGNVSIGGSIQSGSVNSHGNIVIKGGVVGRKSQIRVQGDADVQYIEKGLLAAGGNIVIRTGAYYSSIQAGGNIHCPENVKIVGGDVVAGGCLNCGQIGSPRSERIHIAVGTDPYRYMRYQDLQKEYHEALQETQRWYHRHGRMLKLPERMHDLEIKLRAIEQELSTLNLIPNTPEFSRGESAFFHTLASITTHTGITSGNIIRIGNEVLEIEHNLAGCIVKLDPKTAEIVIDFL